MSFDLDEMIARWRRDMEDTVEPYLWSDDEITEYLDEAQDEFCQEVDVLNHEISISYTASVPWVDIPSYVTRLRDVEDASTGRTIFLYNHEEWPEVIKTDDYGTWIVASDWKQKTGTPEALITDTESGQARVYPIPTADGTFTATVYRRPLEPLADTEEFEVTDRQHQRCMLYKARSLGYLKHDTETFDAAKAGEFEGMFNDKVEEIKSRVSRSRRRARATAYGGL